MIDSHCHLNYLDDPAQVIAAAWQRGVAGILCIGVEEQRIDEVLSFARTEQPIWATVGEHPEAATGNASWVAEYLDAPNVVAVGEMGLDYYRDPSAIEQQKQRDSFAQQLELAAQRDLPVVIHTRHAVEDTLAAMRNAPEVIGVMHCFTESWAMAEQALAMGYYISISGIVTFNKAENVRDIARQIPIDRLLVETDAPYLAPVPHRGKQNQPAYVVDTLSYLAQLRGESVEELTRATTDNFFRLFSRAKDCA